MSELSIEREQEIRERVAVMMTVPDGEVTASVDPRYPCNFQTLATQNSDAASFFGHALADLQDLLTELERLKRIVTLVPSGMRALAEGAALSEAAKAKLPATPAPRERFLGDEDAEEEPF